MQLTIDHFTKHEYKIKKPIRLIELFAGIGAQAKALKNLCADFTHWRICEFDSFAIRSYNAIHGTHFDTSDICRLRGADLGIEDTEKYEYIMTYSFPCQDVSLAGRKKGMAEGSGTRSALLHEVMRLLRETKNKPQLLLMENVPAVHYRANMPVFKGLISELAELGYSNYWADLNAKDFGVPQNRDRCFMVSVLGEHYFEFPDPPKIKCALKDILETKVEKKYYLSEKMLMAFIEQTERKKQKKSGFLCIPKTKEEIARCLTAHGSFSLTDNVLIEEADGVDYGVSDDYFCGTLKDFSRSFCATSVTGVAINGSVFRKLTPLEYMRLMGFTDSDYCKMREAGMSDLRIYMQAGNSIVVKVLESIFRKLL